VLAAQCRAVGERRIVEFTGLARVWRAQGVIRPVDDKTAADLVQALWVIAETWLAFGELDGSYADAEHGTRLLRVVLRPYLTREGGSLATA
jgi:hypothetical protein